MKQLCLVALLVAISTGCDRDSDKPSNPSATHRSTAAQREQAPPTLSAERRQFRTHLVRQMKAGEEVAEPPENLFRVVQYGSEVGKLAAYLTPPPPDGARHPAIIWIHGGECNTIGNLWHSAPPENDQTAAAYREAGIVMMYPSLRGGNENPGFEEGFYGEADDVVAAEEYLARQPYVDPRRIYLGGHSTGGTLALLVAECSDRFRATFCFGPVDNVLRYGRSEPLPFDYEDAREVELRAPGLWLDSVKNPTFVFEGTLRPSNIASLRNMMHAAPPPTVHLFAVPGATHFTILAPMNRLIASKIVQDTGPQTNIAFTSDELTHLLASHH